MEGVSDMSGQSSSCLLPLSGFPIQVCVTVVTPGRGGMLRVTVATWKAKGPKIRLIHTTGCE